MLASVGDAATYREHMDAILEGLPRDFDSKIALIESRLPHITIEEAEGYILTQEL